MIDTTDALLFKCRCLPETDMFMLHQYIVYYDRYDKQDAMLSQKMTARCAPYIAYMGALKFFGSPCMATSTANFPDICNGLLFRYRVTVRTKFEVLINYYMVP